ncbi:MAG: type II toxin-antitoxin system RelE/ParE family toxin [Proteobacteria bacterium]|nr:type II toxin-antitoxin system RelE/ParE family toxin [Pseudomonadota bacterium]MBU1714950.1 type II toxin-antitoxin system RelE/ParE family toxin [Pseudomonadota bacterium]
MSYKLKFLPTALKEWEKLDSSIQVQLKKKLKERLEVPHVPGSQLSGFENHYKIKLRASGYRLVYEVIDNELFVLVIAVGRRDKNQVYKKASKRK